MQRSMWKTLKRPLHTLTIIAMIASSVLAAFSARPALASDTPTPSGVALVGSLQSKIGCPGDWQPECASSQLTYDAGDAIWQGSFAIPAGSYEYKVALNNTWDENYGANAQRGGNNIPLTLGADTTVRFYYDHESHWITSNQTSVIAVAPGSFQSALGCSGDWQPDCLRSWLQDPDGDGIYTFVTTAIPFLIPPPLPWSISTDWSKLLSGAEITRAVRVLSGSTAMSFSLRSSAFSASRRRTSAS